MTLFSSTEQAILAAALEEFSRHGRQGARMQDIADRAGLNKALLHYYFRTKDRLYEEVFTYVFQRYFMRIAETIQDQGDFVSNLRNFIYGFIDLLSANPALPMFMLREVAEGAPVFSRRIVELAADAPFNLPGVFIAFFERGRREGAIVETDPVHSMLSIMGACIYFFAAFPIYAALVPEHRDLKTEILELRKEHVFNLVYLGLKPRLEE